jgi:hypothetical protein
MWLRFVVTQRGGGRSYRPGIFVPAYDLFRGESLSPSEYERLCEILDWFEEHLPLPDRSKLDRGAIFWFKPGADQLIKRIWDLVAFLEEHGYHVELIKAPRPGRVCYEDDYQAAATPFRGDAF